MDSYLEFIYMQHDPVAHTKSAPENVALLSVYQSVAKASGQIFHKLHLLLLVALSTSI